MANVSWTPSDFLISLSWILAYVQLPALQHDRAGTQMQVALGKGDLNLVFLQSFVDGIIEAALEEERLIEHGRRPNREFKIDGAIAIADKEQIGFGLRENVGILSRNRQEQVTQLFDVGAIGHPHRQPASDFGIAVTPVSFIGVNQACGPNYRQGFASKIPIGQTWLCLLSVLVGLVAGCGAILFRGLIGLFHNILFFGQFSMAYDASVHTPASRWGAGVIPAPVLTATALMLFAATVWVKRSPRPDQSVSDEVSASLASGTPPAAPVFPFLR